MKLNDSSNANIKIAYIGGGSRAWAWKLMVDLACEEHLSGEVRLYDIDLPAAQANCTIGNALLSHPDCVGRFTYTVAETLPAALKGADFVVISILPGTLDEMGSDIHTPEAYGIYQSVGDTVGPGGLVRALRTVPMFVEFAHQIRNHCPNAWVINYTNPMSVCIKTLYRVFPEIKAFGCCHEVFGTQELLAEVACLENGLPIGSINRSEIHCNVLGINHFTWFDSASYRGQDLFPIYRQFITKHVEDGYYTKNTNPSLPYSGKNKVKFDLFRAFGWIAAAGDRHLAEFMPGNRYLKNPETTWSWGFQLTSIDFRKQELAERLARSKALVDGTETITLTPSDEESVRIIKALCGLDRLITNVNLPNMAKQISNLGPTAIVETNAIFERDAVRPVYAGELSENLLHFIEPHLGNHDHILKAALTRDYKPALRAFRHDPLIAGRLSDADADKLLHEMVRNTAAYLPKEWQIDNEPIA